MGSFQYYEPAQNHPISHILFHKNVSPRDFDSNQVNENHLQEMSDTLENDINPVQSPLKSKKNLANANDWPQQIPWNVKRGGDEDNYLSYMTANRFNPILGKKRGIRLYRKRGSIRLY